MKFPVAVVLFGLIAVVLAEPASRSRRAVQSWPNSSVDCNDGKVGILQVVPQVANVLDNIVFNIGYIWARSQIVGTVHLATMKSIMIQLRGSLTICLSATVQTDAAYIANEQLIVDLLAQLVALLDTLLGPGHGHSYCCTSGGPISTVSASLISTVGSAVVGISRIDNILLSPVLQPCLVSVDFIIYVCG